MSLFISLDAQDVLRQAAAATERYQQGMALLLLFPKFTLTSINAVIGEIFGHNRSIS